PNAEGTTLALTLIRSVGWLSRGDLRLRNGHAGPGLTTPGGQSPGQHRFEYALSTYSGGWEHADVVKQAHDFAYPALSIMTETNVADVAPVQLDNPRIVVSAITPARRGGFLLRCYNPHTKDEVA